MLTQRAQAIILCSIIGSLLAEYSIKESTKEVNELKRLTKRFMMHESRRDAVLFLSAIKIGDEVWRKSVEHYCKKSITINAVTMILMLWDFNKEALTKYANISKKRMDAYTRSSKYHDKNMEGFVVGGYIVELLAGIIGNKVSGKMMALKLKIVSGL